VTLVSTPTALETPLGVNLVNVHSAAEMLDAVLNETKAAGALIMAAAVADFTPEVAADQKIKKDGSSLTLELKPTEDILLRVAEAKSASGFPKVTVGFAAESENLLQNAAKKIEKKKLDMIVANDISNQASGFEVENNTVTLLFKNGEQEALPIMTKGEVAERIMERIIPWLP
jgi:phosphopantothenoylcysteine decarboxylase/phosphopantothenate--cysteine ligase